MTIMKITKKEIEEAVERLHERFGAEEYEGHTPKLWKQIVRIHKAYGKSMMKVYRTIAMVHPTQYWEDMSEAEFMRMMADKELSQMRLNYLLNQEFLIKLLHGMKEINYKEKVFNMS